MDNNNVPWFPAFATASILQYINKDDAIRRHVNVDDKTTLKNL